MRRLAIALLALAPAYGGEAPLIVIRKPDSKTAQEMRRLITRGLNSGTRKVRREARRKLILIGPWSVNPLSDALVRTGSDTTRQNAAMTLAWIGDARGLPALRHAANHPEKFVARTACLALGRFALPEDLELLRRQFDAGKRAAPAAALALAKLGDDATLFAQSQRLPKDASLAAAVLIASAIVEPKTDCVRHLGHKEDLVRRAAVTGLMIRPLGEQAEQVLLELLRRPPRAENADIRALQYLALARSRSRAVRLRLLDAATKERERKEVRIAALTGLSFMFGDQESYKPLRKAYRRITSRSDPLVGAMLFAIARSSHPESIGFLMDVAKRVADVKRSYYATGSIIHAVTCVQDNRSDGILAQLAQLKSRDGELNAMFGLAQGMRHHSPWTKRRDKAREAFALIEDPFRQHLWDFTDVDRAWNSVNVLLPLIFGLDDIADRADVGSRAPEEPTKGGDGNKDGDKEPSRASAEGSPAEQDLLDFLWSRPLYFTQEDLRGG